MDNAGEQTARPLGLNNQSIHLAKQRTVEKIQNRKRPNEQRLTNKLAATGERKADKGERAPAAEDEP